VGIALNVPQEVIEALEARTFSLHIKGSAGTGKTTMALELMKLFPEESEAVYLSTRVSPDRLYEQFPWSKSFIHKENIIDAKSTWYPKTKEETVFEYVDKPTFLRSLYSRALEAEKKRLIIIVDSLEALKSNLRIPENDMSVERDILEMADRLDANVIFISELSGESKLDYLVDGVVRLEKEIVDERLLRKLYIEKVRGTSIENPMYLFTLRNGRFTCFEKGFQINFTCEELPKVERKEGRKIPTLVDEIDKILGGGFEKGSFNIFDVEDNVGRGHACILSHTFFGFMRQGFPVFYIPSKGITSSDIIGHVPPTFLDDNFLNTLKRYFYVFKPKQHINQPESRSYNKYTIEGKDYGEDMRIFRETVSGVLRDVRTDTFVVVMASDTMEYIYGSREIIKIIQSYTDEVKQLNGIMIVVQFGHESFKLPSHLAASHFRIVNIAGNIIFYGEEPRTKMYVATLNISGKHIRPNLIPIE